MWTEEAKAQMVATRRANRELRKSGGAEHISKVRHGAVMARWDSVREERENWLKPFHELELERAMRYLEDLRVVTTQAGEILNIRINSDTKIKCSGPRCGKSVEGLRPNGMPKWIKKMDFKDKNNPEIWHCLYFCSELCANEFTRSQMGGAGTDGK